MGTQPTATQPCQECSWTHFPPPLVRACVRVLISAGDTVSVIFAYRNTGLFSPLFLLLFQRCPKNRAPLHPPTSSNVSCFPGTTGRSVCPVWTRGLLADAGAGLCDRAGAGAAALAEAEFGLIVPGKLGSQGDSHLPGLAARVFR